MWALPSALLLPVACYTRGLRLPMLLAGLLLVGVIQPVCFSRAGILGGKCEPDTLRVLTCNAQGQHLDIPALRKLIADFEPDLVALQEYDVDVRQLFANPEQYHIQQQVGLRIVSRFPICATRMLTGRDVKGSPGVIACELETPHGRMQWVNVHLASPRDGLQAVIDFGLAGRADIEINTELRREGSELVRSWIQMSSLPTLVTGDFNLVEESTIFRAEWSHWSDAFQVAGAGWGNTKFTSLHGVRIDHVLYDGAWRAEHCWVGPDVGSDHRPVFADLKWVGK